MLLDQYYQPLNNFLLRVKQRIHYVDMFDSDYVMICSTAIPSVANTPRKFYFVGTLLDESTSTYYHDKNDNFDLLFQHYTDSAVDKIYHPSIVK